jgi:hypothetical protein
VGRPLTAAVGMMDQRPQTGAVPKPNFQGHNSMAALNHNMRAASALVPNMPEKIKFYEEIIPRMKQNL